MPKMTMRVILKSGEKCDCRAAEADGNAEKELKERTKDNDN